MTGEIKVVFYDGSNGQNYPNPKPSAEDEGDKIAPQPQQKSTNSIAKSTLVQVGIQMARQTLGFGLSMYGDITGDYIQQNKLNNYASVVALGVSACNFPIGTTMAIAQVTTSLISSNIATTLAQEESKILRERTGNSAFGNSMGGF